LVLDFCPDLLCCIDEIAGVCEVSFWVGIGFDALPVIINVFFGKRGRPQVDSFSGSWWKCLK